MIGQNIRMLLEKHNRSISDLARHCDVTPQAAHQWVSDITQPKGRRKTAIAEFFNIAPQELEYGPVLSFIPIAKSDKTSKLDRAKSEYLADLMITNEIANAPRSEEFKLGMRYAFIYRLSGISEKCPFEAGTCQADAFESGYSNGEILVDKI